MRTLEKTRKFMRAARLPGVIAVAMLAFTGMGQAQMSMERLTIGTGPAGSLYGQLGSTISTVLQENSSVTATPRPHSGTSQYLPMLQRGEIQLGLNSALDSGLAYGGGEPYGTKMRNLRGIAQVLEAPFGFIAAEGSGMRTIDDIRGKRVNIRVRALAAFVDVNRAILATAGLSEDDVTSVDETNVLTSMRALPEGRLDITNSILFTAAHREADAALPKGTRVLSLGKNLEAVANLTGFRVIKMQPGPGRVGILEPTTLLSLGSLLTTGVHMNNDDVYEIARILHTNWQTARDSLPALRGFTPEQMMPERLSVPFHDGAIRYFREIGLWTAAHDKQQAALLAQ